MKGIFGFILSALLAMQVSFAQDLQTKVVELEENYCPSKVEPDQCSSIYVSRLEVLGQPWLTRMLDEDLFNIDDWTKAQRKALQKLDLKQQREILKEELKRITTIEDENIYHSAIVRVAKMTGQGDGFAAFSIHYSIYSSGAAHGQSYLQHRIFDLKKRKEVQWQDIWVSKMSEAKIQVLQKQAVLKYLQKEAGYSAEEIKNLEGDESFVATDNWTLKENALGFTFQPYEVGPYYLGMPKVEIPISQLEGIVRPEYLKAAANWHEVKTD